MPEANDMPGGDDAAGTESFEQLLSEAEAIADRLERGEMPLEESLRQYEAGTSRLRGASVLLAAAETRLKELVESHGGFALVDREELLDE